MSRKKIVQLSLDDVDTILYFANPEDREIDPGSRGMVPELPASILATLERARTGDGPAYHVPLAPDEAHALSQWCRTAAPPVGGFNTDSLVKAAAKIDATS